MQPSAGASAVSGLTNQRKPPTVLTKKQERLAQRIVAALVLAERSTGDARADHLREAAGLASDLRMTFPTSQNDDRPDVRGRSYGYRMAMRDVFAKAESGQEIRTAFRYHMNVVHKERLDPALLAEFGLDERTRHQQMEARRQAQATAAAVGRAAVVSGPVRARLRALSDAERLLSTLDTRGLEELSDKDRKAARVMAESIVAVASEVLRVTK